MRTTYAGYTMAKYRYDEFGNVTYEEDCYEVESGFSPHLTLNPVEPSDEFVPERVVTECYVENPYRYAGYEYLENVDLYDLNARYYDPNTARFLSEDPYYDLGNRVMGLYEINVPNVFSIMQANTLYAYCGNCPVIFVDSSGHDITLPGITDQEDPRFIALQQLTDDELTVDFLSGQVSLKQQASEEHMTKPTGTNLIREVLNHPEMVEIITTDGGSRKIPVGYYDEKNDKLYTNIVIEYNPNQKGKVPTVKGMLDTPNYIVLGHEIIHAYREQNNLMSAPNEKGWVYPLWEDDIPILWVTLEDGTTTLYFDDVEELQTVGLPYTKGTNVSLKSTVDKSNKCNNAFVKYDYTENALRVENQIPIRTRYVP